MIKYTVWGGGGDAYDKQNMGQREKGESRRKSSNLKIYIIREGYDGWIWKWGETTFCILQIKVDKKRLLNVGLKIELLFFCDTVILYKEIYSISRFIHKLIVNDCLDVQFNEIFFSEIVSEINKGLLYSFRMLIRVIPPSRQINVVFFNDCYPKVNWLSSPHGIQIIIRGTTGTLRTNTCIG